MEWKLLIHFNDKSDGIFQIDQHPSEMCFATWMSAAPEEGRCGASFMARVAGRSALTLTV